LGFFGFLSGLGSPLSFAFGFLSGLGSPLSFPFRFLSFQ
jgi:hypothetical protein